MFLKLRERMKINNTNNTDIIIIIHMYGFFYKQCFLNSSNILGKGLILCGDIVVSNKTTTFINVVKNNFKQEFIFFKCQVS